LESLDNDRVLPETEPFVDSLRVRINERVKVDEECFISSHNI
jgi:hypothetical protein